LIAALALVSSGFVATFSTFVPGAPASSAAPLSIQVAGNQLVNGSGTPVQLRGVNRSGTEYACQQGWGIFDGSSDDASVAAIASWHTNVVRIPMNEDCWLGINGVNPAFGGANYQQAIEAYVSLLHQHGLYAILDLAVVDPGDILATGLQQMPDQDHSPAFWASVAAAFKDDPAAIFDLFNEPYPGNNTTSDASWTCWRDGGTCDGLSYQAAGMQELVNTVRAAGANNVIMLGGIGYASVLDQWAAYEPVDPAGQLAASLHDYNFGGCTTSDCWNATLAAVGNAPLITGEMGFDGYIEPYMTWADAHGVGYLAWTWDTWGCDGGQALISDYDGAPCDPYGTGYQQHLAALALTPTHLAFTTQPGGGTAGQAWSTQPEVTIENVDGNAVTSDTSPVTLSIQTNPGSGTLSTCSAPTVAGVATFSGCQIDKAATGYALTATDSTDSLSATSSTFNISAGAPAQLVFTTQPGGGTAGQAWSTQPVIAIEDANGNVVTSDASTVTLSMQTNPAGAPAQSVCSASAVAGVATFSGCQINRAGTGYALTATDTTDSLTAMSNSVNITAGAPSQLVFSVQPGGGARSVVWASQPTVTIEDANANPVTSDAAVITLTIAPGTGDRKAHLTGCSASTTAGVAAFSGCQINQVATGYQLTANDSADSITATSAGFDITSPPAHGKKQ
jgi:hypothetical protein